MSRVLLSLLTLLAATGYAQNAVTTVVADAETHLPVSHASLYTKEGGRFRSVITNGQGVARVGFQFQRLTVSHLNYERLIVRQLSDTIFLKPKYLSTGEVVVTNKEPEWIRRCLKETVKRKTQNYFSHDGHAEDDDQHVHFYCERCHRTFCLTDMPIPTVSLPAGYELHDINYMAKGLCPECSSAC